ncbi:hypothetical protein BRC81_16970 [Halobacteriales archaeon QS_1_68_20]|nr:MAG: hypothetical protein BRC81_16970 [Halobacteriales archaeon QS_1_68_20]
MTRIEELHVDGFKGLTDTDLEFGRLNVVTGRNNTGKTSLLEAIEVGLAPEGLKEYEDRVGDLVNVRTDECHIALFLTDDQCSLTLEFTPQAEALDFAIDALVSTVSVAPPFATSDDVDVSEAIERVLRTELADAKPGEVRDIENKVLSVSFGGDDFRITPVDENLIKLIGNREEEIRSALESETGFAQWHEKMDVDDVMRYIWITPSPPFQNYFYPDPPEGPDDVLFVEQPKIDDPPETDDENAAIKKVEIRDYLNEHEITPEPGVTVEDFDFDVIVFEEDGERFQVPYDFMGDGFKTIVGILWQFVGEDDVSDVVLMEEPENHMHPGYVGELVPFLVDVAREEDVQLFVTTHNVDFISEFFGEFSDDEQEFLESEFRLIQMTETVAKTFDYADAKEQVEDLHLDLRGI